MSDIPVPGWFPDQADPELERLWDGERWTENTRPRRTAPTPPTQPSTAGSDSSTVPTAFSGPPPAIAVGEASAGSNRRVWAIIGALGVGAVVVFVILQAMEANSSGGSSKNVTCEGLASEAVRISRETNAGSGLPLLLRVERPTVVSDTQATAQPPTSGEITVLECRGTGYFSSTDVTPVRLQLTLDPDGMSWVAYESE